MFGLFRTCRSSLSKIYQVFSEKYKVTAKFLSTLTNLRRFRLLLNGYLSLPEMLKLDDHQLKVIADPAIFKSIHSKQITIRQAIELSYDKFQILSNKSFIREHIDNGNITVKQVIELDDYQIGLLSNQRSWVYRLIDIGKYNIKDIINLSHQNFEKLEQEYRHFPDLLGLNLTINEVLNLTAKQTNKFDVLIALIYVDVGALDFYHRFIYDGYFGNTNLLPLIFNTPPSAYVSILRNKKIQNLIALSKLSVELALTLTPDQENLLTDPAIYKLIMKYKKQPIQAEQILNLTPREIEILQITNISSLILAENSQFDFKDALVLTDNQIKNLQSLYVYCLVDSKKLSLKDALNLNDNQRETLNLYIIFKLIENKKLKLQDALELNLTPEQRNTLTRLTPLIEGEKIELREVLILTPDARRALCSNRIQQLIINNKLPLVQILHLAENNEQAIINLSHRIIFDLIMRGALSVVDATLLTEIRLTEITERERIRRNANMQGRNILPVFDKYRGAQNTHTASIHKTVSISAKNLYECYKEKIQCHQDQDQILEEIKQWSLSVSDDGSVKVCVEKISSEPIGRHKDPFSGISVYQLLMLAWCAIHDTDKRMGSKEDALKLLADGLSEILNQYGSWSIPMCCGGAFNKIIEKLVGVIDGVELKVITIGQATNKMYALVETAIKDYVANLVAEGSSKTECIEKLKREGISIIWEKVGDQIQKELMDEYGELFNNSIDDLRFKDFISARDDVDLDKIFPLISTARSSVAATACC